MIFSPFPTLPGVLGRGGASKVLGPPLILNSSLTGQFRRP
jgi:hypothetical protein